MIDIKRRKGKYNNCRNNKKKIQRENKKNYVNFFVV